jgi:hypothetical protein
MEAVSRRDELRAEIEGLPWQKREALNEAVSEGRAVDDENLASLAAEWAAERQREMLRIYFGILAAVLVVGLVLLSWLLVSNDPEGSVGDALFAGGTAVAMMGLILWAVTWRPLVRAERANLALAGVGEPPRRREPSHWVIAWLVAWPIAFVVGVLLRAVGVTALAGPLGIVVFLQLVWVVKRALDSREP